MESGGVDESSERRTESGAYGVAYILGSACDKGENQNKKAAVSTSTT